jgi:hypothetical protein
MKSDLTELLIKIDTWRFSLMQWSQGSVTASGYIQGAGALAGNDGYPMPFSGVLISLATKTSTGTKISSSAQAPIAFAASDSISLYAYYDNPYITYYVRKNGVNTLIQTDLNATGAIFGTLLLRVDQSHA